MKNILNYFKNVNWREVLKYLIITYFISIIIVLISFFLIVLKDGGGFGKTFMLVMQSLIAPSGLYIILILATLLVLAIALLHWLIKFLFSKEIKAQWKILHLTIIVIFFIVLAVQWMIIRDYKKYPTILPEYSYNDFGNYIYVKGTWLAKELAFPIQTSEIRCDRKRGLAIEVGAQLGRYSWLPILSLDYKEWKIKNWTKSKVTFEDDASSLAVIYRLHIDRKNKLVTMTRVTKKGFGDKFVQKEPILMRLGEPSRIERLKR